MYKYDLPKDGSWEIQTYKIHIEKFTEIGSVVKMKRM